MKTIDWIKPDIYDKFQCKGSGCRRTCCAGWRITVSKTEYQDLKRKLSQMDARILQRMPEKDRSTQVYGEFILGQTGCSLQTEEGLCSLQLSLGADALPSICTFFPRHGMRCGDEMQVSLTPACEAVLELLLEQETPLRFIREKEPLVSMPLRRFSGKDRELKWNSHLQLQEFCILLLQAEDTSLDQRMALLGIGLHQIDALYKKGNLRKVSGCMEHYLKLLSEAADAGALLPSESFSSTFLLGSFLSSTAFSNRYPMIVARVKKELQATVHVDKETGKPTFSYSPEAYEQKKELFRRFTGHHPFFLENLMVMLFFMKGWASLPGDAHSIWEQYMYACWVYSNLKFALTACMREDTIDEEVLDICVVLLRSWIHSEEPKKKIIKEFHDNKSDTPAHMAMLVQAG